MPYLKAMVLEELRRHPPGHFVLPHKVTKDVEDDPMEFKPKRFMLNDGSNIVFDISGSKRIKMMKYLNHHTMIV
ncbi:cytochrome P450 [Artemisia annua]|uniref:Cytochrome P450 n=1 Tax=Artemisia annua TaxID=35608 RepID=A0A2U1Q0G0_ARTAN|nr:cytochrome P450 [Artemisia annua]